MKGIAYVLGHLSTGMLLNSIFLFLKFVSNLIFQQLFIKIFGRNKIQTLSLTLEISLQRDLIQGQ